MLKNKRISPAHKRWLRRENKFKRFFYRHPITEFNLEPLLETAAMFLRSKSTWPLFASKVYPDKKPLISLVHASA